VKKREKRVSSPHINTESKRENLEGVFFSLSLSLSLNNNNNTGEEEARDKKERGILLLLWLSCAYFDDLIAHITYIYIQRDLRFTHT